VFIIACKIATDNKTNIRPKIAAVRSSFASCVFLGSPWLVERANPDLPIKRSPRITAAGINISKKRFIIFERSSGSPTSGGGGGGLVFPVHSHPVPVHWPPVKGLPGAVHASKQAILSQQEQPTPGTHTQSCVPEQEGMHVFGRHWKFSSHPTGQSSGQFSSTTTSGGIHVQVLLLLPNEQVPPANFKLPIQNDSQARPSQASSAHSQVKSSVQVPEPRHKLSHAESPAELAVASSQSMGGRSLIPKAFWGEDANTENTSNGINNIL